MASVDERVAAGPGPPGLEPGGRFAAGARGPAEPAAAMGVLLLALAIQAAPLPLEARCVGSYVLLVVLPGWLLVSLALGPAGGPRCLERALLALGAGYSLAMLLGLAVYALARPAAAWQITTGAGVLNLVLLALARRRGARLAPRLSRPAAAPLLVLAIAGPLRLADLGWSEFQGDEARILLRAMAALQGLPDALAAHRKVPGEILLSLVFYGQLGAVTELVGRLPFALAGLAGVLAFYELGCRLFGRGVGLLAAVLLAVDGYSVAFGRILQYDSLAFLLGTLGLLCCLRFGRAERPEPGLSLVGSLCLFGALLVSLGSVFFLLPALILAAPGLRRCRGLGWRTLALWCWPAVPALLAALLVLRGGEATGPPPPGAGPIGVWSYLGPRLGGGRPYLNHELFLKSANHYLSTVYLGAVLAGAAGAILLALDRRLRDRRTVAAALVLGCALAALAFGWGQPRVALLLGAIAAVLLVATSRGEPPGRRMALVWAGGPLLVHLFLVRFPGTHWREVFPGLILLAAGPAVAAVRRLPPGWPGLVPVAGLVVLIGGAASYSWVTLVQRWPEYQMSFPQYRHPLDRTSSDGRGIGGVFGVAHHHGWKALAIADLDGRFPGSYATNESPAIAAWYLRRPQGCPEPPAFVFRAPRAPQDRGLVGPVELPSDYVVGGRVVVDGHPTIAILVPPGAPEVGTIGPDGLEERFDRERASPWLPVGDLYRADLGAAAARRACGSG